MIDFQELKTLISLGFKKGDIENFYNEKIDFNNYLATVQKHQFSKQNQQGVRELGIQTEQHGKTAYQQQPAPNEHEGRDEQFEKLFARLDKLEHMFGMTQQPGNENNLATIIYPGE